MRQQNIIWTLFSVFVAVFVTSQAFAQSDVIEKRQKLMKSQSKDSKAIKAAVESKDYATIEAKAKEIMGTAEKIPDLFPKGSAKGETRAKAEIWDKWDDFTKKAKSLNKAAGELAAAAKAKDDAAVTAKVKAVGGACSGCHKAFREKKKTE
ncbi:MAG: c-type cytochrome [Candidatus Binatia bacterium]